MSATVINKFRLIGGRFYAPKPGFVGSNDSPDRMQLFVAGKPGHDIVESERDLEQAFQNKFRRLSDEEQAPAIDIAKRRENVALLIQGGVWQEDDRAFLEKLTEDNFARLTQRFKDSMGNKVGDNKVNSILGEDVTNEYSRAYDGRLKVFRNANKKFQVTTLNDTGKPLNEDPLSKGDVDKFIEAYLKG